MKVRREYLLLLLTFLVALGHAEDEKDGLETPTTNRRRLVVRKRKRPDDLKTVAGEEPQLQEGQGPPRDGRSLVGNSPFQNVGEGENPYRARGSSILQQPAFDLQNFAAPPPQVLPSLLEHQQALQLHQEQLQAHLSHSPTPQQQQQHQEPLTVLQHSVHFGVLQPQQPLPAVVVRLEPVSVRQGVATASQVPIDFAQLAAVGEKCIDKIVGVQEQVSDETVECHHSYGEKCHTTYTTDFSPQQEEKCEENFKKNCYIEYKKVAKNETIVVCHTPLVKDCNIPGPVECRTEYESECMTRYHKHTVEDDIPECTTHKERKCETKSVGYSTEEDCTEWPVERCSLRTEVVEKSTPETSCKKVPKEKCAPIGCSFVPGPEECFDKTETVVLEVPEENCNLEPHQQCKHVTTLVPNLRPSEECVSVPKESCVRSNENPRQVTKPVVKKWCYTPSLEAGIFRRK